MTTKVWYHESRNRICLYMFIFCRWHKYYYKAIFQCLKFFLCLWLLHGCLLCGQYDVFLVSCVSHDGLGRQFLSAFLVHKKISLGKYWRTHIYTDMLSLLCDQQDHHDATKILSSRWILNVANEAILI